VGNNHGLLLNVMSCKMLVNMQGYLVAFWFVRWTLLIERSGFEPLPGSLCCVLGHDTLL